MKIRLVCVGRPRGPIAEAIGVYEARIKHYFGFESIEIRETVHRGQSVDQVMSDEGERLLARVTHGAKVIVLHRPGAAWSSETFAEQLREAGLRSVPELTFIIGGAYGLSPAVLRRADLELSLSAMTLPHELARLLLTEQIYRAGTILRGEPYHKGKGT
jgi:23S rRNA (pseudouridine1915-N3)-methyltransferase